MEEEYIRSIIDLGPDIAEYPGKHSRTRRNVFDDVDSILL